MNKLVVAVAVGLSLGLSGCAHMSDGQSASGDQYTMGKAAGSSERAQLVYELLAGEIAGKRGMLAEAAGHYQSAAELSDDAGIAERSTKIALFASDWAQARESVVRWIELDPANAEAHQMAGLLYMQSEEPIKAFEHLDWVIAHAEGDHAALFQQLGATVGKDNINTETVEVFRLLKDKYATVPEAQLTYSRVASGAGQTEEALRGIDDTLALDPENLDAKVLRNRILMSVGRTDEALASMSKLSDRHVERETVRLDYARMLVQAKRYPEALTEFSRVMERLPQDMNLVYSTALLHIELGQHKDARQYLLKLIHSRPHQDAAQYYLGRIDEIEKSWDSAIAWYAKVGEGEYYYDAQSNVAEILGQMGQVDDARTMLERLRNETESDSVRIRLYLAEGEILHQAGLNEQGMTLLTDVLQKYPSNIEVLYARGMLADSVNRLDVLEADMKAILVQEPDNATALNALGYTLADRTKRYDEAYDYIRKALELRPDDAAVLDSMGWVYYRMGKFEKAMEYLNKAHSLLQDPEVSSHLGEVQWAIGLHQEAKETVQRALRDAPEDSRLLQLLKQFEK